MPDYSKASIYKIVCNITGNIYIGSTCQPLHKRLSQHLIEFKSGKYLSSSEIIENGNYSIILVEQYPCQNRNQLLRKEREYIDTLECVNKQTPFVTVEEMKKRLKTHYENNKEHIKKYKKEWCINNKEKLKEKSKEYRQINKEELSLKKKQYYEAHKEKIIQKDSKRVVCSICSQDMNRSSLYRHKQSKHKVDFTCTE